MSPRKIVRSRSPRARETRECRGDLHCEGKAFVSFLSQVSNTFFDSPRELELSSTVSHLAKQKRGEEGKRWTDRT